MKKSRQYIESISNIIGYNRCYVTGSYIKYGKDKTCDIDCGESMNDIDKFNNYIKRLYNDYKNHKLLLVTSYFNIKHPLIYELYILLGSIDGVLNIIDEKPREIIFALIDKIKDDTILDLYNKYLEQKTLDCFIKLKMYIIDKVYPKWTFTDLLKGYIEHYGVTFNIKDFKFETFYIEIIYLEDPFKNVRMSNFIEFKQYENKKINIEKELDNIILNDKVYYYYLVKTVMFFFKKYYYTNVIKEYKLRKNMMNIYDMMHKFRDQYGEMNNKYCIIKNHIDIAKLKIKKYNIKLKRDSNNKKYIKKLNKYKQIYDKNMVLYKTGTNEINQIYKSNYNKWTKKYRYYLKKLIKFI